MGTTLLHAYRPIFALPSPIASLQMVRGSLWKASRHIEPANGARRLRKRAKFLARALVNPRLTRAWLGQLLQPDVAPLWAARPRLALKLQRPFVSCEWGALERFAALLGHYSRLPQLLSSEVLPAVYGGGIDLIQITNKTTGRRLSLQLLYSDQFEKEGELTLALVDKSQGMLLAALTFVLVQSQGRNVAIIGGLQGGASPGTSTCINETTKEMHGLRPKAFVLWALQQAAVFWHVQAIEAVCDKQHIHRHWRKGMTISASYDEFWSESDGRRLPGGGWELPLQPRIRSREELKPSRRKQHERRYALLGELSCQLVAALSDLAPGTQAARALAAGPRQFSFASKDTSPAAPSAAASSSHEQLPVFRSHSY